MDIAIKKLFKESFSNGFRSIFSAPNNIANSGKGGKK